MNHVRRESNWILFTGRVGGLRLLSLPNEILTMVCADENLSTHDLAAIRLTCKELNAVATKEFAQRYFRDPFVMMSRESLEALIKICKHPIFGPQVQKVQLLNARVHTSWLDKVAARLSTAVDNKQTVETNRSRSEMKWFLELIEGQHDFAQSGEALALLKEAFKSLEGHGHPIAIAAQRLSMLYRPIGLKEALDGTEKSAHQIFAEPDMVSTLRLLLDAVSSTECIVGRLEVGIDSVHSPPRGRGWNKLQSLRQSRRPLHMHGEEFHIDIKGHTIYGRVNDQAPRLLPAIIERTPRNLKCFSLCSDCSPRRVEGLLLEKISWLRWYDALEELSLTKLCLTAQQLRDFLDFHKPSLKRLILSQLILVGDWDRLLFWISQTLTLEQFKIDQGYGVVQPGDRYASAWYTTSCHFRGKQAVCQGLDAFIRQQATDRQAEELRRMEEERQSWGSLRRGVRARP